MASSNWSILYGMFSFFAGILCLAISIYLAPHFRQKNAFLLMALMICVGVWSMAYGMEFISAPLVLKLFWVKIKFLGNAWVAVFLLFFIVGIVNGEKPINKKALIGLGLVPVAIILLVLTNDSHNLMWEAAWVDASGSAPVLVYSRNWVFWSYVCFSYGLIFLATMLLVKHLFYASGNLKKQIILLLAGISIPWISNMLYQFRFEALNYFDLTPMALSITGLIFAFGIYKYHMPGLVPLAHETLADSMNDPMIILDNQDRILFLNKAALAQIGMDRIDPSRYSLQELFPKLQPQLMTYRNLYPENEFGSYVVKTMSRQWYLKHFPLLNKIDEKIGWVVSLRDITNIRNIEKALENSEKDLKLERQFSEDIIDSMPSILIGLDLNRRITHWNIEAQRSTKIQSEAAKGKELNQVFPDLWDQIPLMDELIKKRKIWIGNKIQLVAGGSQILADITIYPVISGAGQGAVIRVDDISEKTRIEEMMVQSEKMLSIGGLAAGMAHEINNPLAGILQNIQVIWNRLGQDLPTNVQTAAECGIDLKKLEAYMEKRNIFSLMERVRDSGKNAARVVTNMLSFVQKSDHKKKVCNLDDVMEETLELVKNDYTIRQRYDFESIDIVKEYKKNLPGVRCEKNEIQQVFLNILKNGAHAMAERPDSSPCFVFRYFKTMKHVVFEIQDNGIGMEKSVQKRIFEPFYTSKAIGMGTGLGLSVSYFIICENHQGFLSVKSSPGKGSTFTIKLPIGNDQK